MVVPVLLAVVLPSTDGGPLFSVAFSRERRLNCWDTMGVGKGGPLTMSTTEDFRWSL